MKTLQLLAFGFLIFIALPTHAELEGRAYFDESSRRFPYYVRPKITIPSGWEENVALGFKHKAAFLLREGKKLQNSDVWIYAHAHVAAGAAQHLESLIKEDIDSFIKDQGQVKVIRLPNAKTASGYLISYQFFIGDGSVQTVAYGAEEDHFINIALTGESLAAHDNGLSAFKQILSQYRSSNRKNVKCYYYDIVDMDDQMTEKNVAVGEHPKLTVCRRRDGTKSLVLSR